ncbi:MAG TPA: hypothetical protein VK054_13840, partial [Beutenbergiaceae bacterium]|nr:hypothetical protein [Beutenbergiaceae bacterium]
MGNGAHPPIDLPDVDIRHRLDLAVRRGWAEVGRRLLRRVTLLVGDLAATALAAFLASTVMQRLSPPGEWGLSEVSSIMVFLLLTQPLTLGVFGAYGGGRLRRGFGRVAR